MTKSKPTIHFKAHTKHMFMQEKIYHLRSKNVYVTALIEDLIKVHAVEVIPEGETIELIEQQKAALDNQLANISSNRDFSPKWNNIL